MYACAYVYVFVHVYVHVPGPQASEPQTLVMPQEVREAYRKKKFEEEQKAATLQSLSEPVALSGFKTQHRLSMKEEGIIFCGPCDHRLFGIYTSTSFLGSSGKKGFLESHLRGDMVRQVQDPYANVASGALSLTQHSLKLLNYCIIGSKAKLRTDVGFYMGSYSGLVRVLMLDPCPSGLPKTLTVAQLDFLITIAAMVTMVSSITFLGIASRPIWIQSFVP